MHTLTLDLELLNDVVFTMQSATAGAPRTLDRIPGAALLGACAARLPYSKLLDADAWLVFHSGQVRFGDGLPLAVSGPCLPMPTTFHHLKGDDGKDADGHLSAGVRNAGRVELEPGAPWKQLRSGYVAPDLRVIQPARVQVQRTALQDGRARDGFLYSLDALAAGSRFRAIVSFAPEVPESLQRDVERSLLDGELRLGRSRSAEYGRVRAIRASDSPDPWRICDSVGPVSLLLARSDLALRDPVSGAPTVEPGPLAMGLPEGAFVWMPAHSSVRVRRYSPFNGKRRRPDIERQVIAAGSVIAVRTGRDWSPARIAEALTAGVGEHRQDGLGVLLVDPRLLSSTVPRAVAAVDAASSTVEPTLPGDETGRWLDAAHKRKLAADQALGLALDWAEAMARWPALPASQWGEVRRLAARSGSPAELKAALFDDGRGFSRTGLGKLEQRWGAKHRGETRRDALRRLIVEAGEPDATVLLAVQLLAVHVVRRRRSREEER